MAKRTNLPATKPADPLLEAAAELDTGDLTIQELKFAMTLLGGATQKEAVLQACPENAHWSDAALRVKGNRWASRAHVRDFLDQARRSGAALGASSLGAYVSDVARSRQLATDAGQFSAVARMHETEGKALGHLSAAPGGHEMPALNPGELIASVRMRLGDEAGRRLALKLGLLDAAGPEIGHGS